MEGKSPRVQHWNSAMTATGMRIRASILLAAVAVAVVLAVAARGAEVDVRVTRSVDGCTTKTKKGDNVAVHYKGFLDDGTIFDDSTKRGQPISFRLGAGQVIQGWDKGIIGMCVGEERKLTIPGEMAYGALGVPQAGIPPDATLVFETSLVSIN